MKFLILFIFLSGTPDCPSDEIRYTADRIIIINSFDAQLLHARKNKKELFRQLADSLKHMLRHELDRTSGSDISCEIIVVPEFVRYTTDTTYKEFINVHPGTKVIVIKDLDTYFNQTGVEVTKEGSSKSRVASFDINADVVYAVYGINGLIKEFKTQTFEFFTERNVISGLLAAGPDIVGKKKHAFGIVQKNAEQFVKEMKVYFQND